MREVQEGEALLEKKSSGAKESAVTAGRRERVSACVAHVEPSFSDEDSEEETEPKVPVSPDSKKSTVESVEHITQVVQA